jgi:hypothetical protein
MTSASSYKAGAAPPFIDAPGTVAPDCQGMRGCEMMEREKQVEPEVPSISR